MMDNWLCGARGGGRAYLQRAAIACAMLLSGCGASPVAKYYVLSVATEPAAASDAAVPRDKFIGIGPVVLPDYLDQPQIVIRASSNRLELVEGHRWAEPLTDSFSRVLRENLSLLLGTERVLARSSLPSARGDYQVMVQVLRFDAAPDGIVNLVARWSVTAKDGALLVPTRRSAFDVTPAGTSVEALVAAQSEAVARLSREIAAALTGR